MVHLVNFHIFDVICFKQLDYLLKNLNWRYKFTFWNRFFHSHLHSCIYTFDRCFNPKCSFLFCSMCVFRDSNPQMLWCYALLSSKGTHLRNLNSSNSLVKHFTTSASWHKPLINIYSKLGQDGADESRTISKREEVWYCRCLFSMQT